MYSERKGILKWLNKVLCVAVVMIVYAAGAFGFYLGTEKSFAEDAAKSLISEQLLSPSSAIWNEVKYIEDDGEGKYIVYVDVEASNAYGGMIRKKYFVCVFDLDTSKNTYSHHPLYGCMECAGKDDETVLSVMKAGNEFGKKTENTEKEKENDDGWVDVIMVVLVVAIVLMGGYVSAYILLYKKGKLQKLKAIFEPLDMLVKKNGEKKKIEEKREGQQDEEQPASDSQKTEKKDE